MPGPGRPRKRPEEDSHTTEVGGAEGIGSINGSLDGTAQPGDIGEIIGEIIGRLDHIAWLLEIICLKLSNSPLELMPFLEREAKINSGPNYEVSYASPERDALQDDEERWA